MNGGWSSADFDEVRVFWRPLATGGGYDVRVDWRGEEIVVSRLDQRRPSVPFSLYSEDGSSLILSGSLRYQPEDAACPLLLHLTSPESQTTTSCLRDEPAEGGTEDIEPVAAALAHGDLFPYVFLRPWPGVSPAQQEDRFVPYVPPATPSSFYSRLVALKQQKDRAGMEQLAVQFVDAGPPFVRRLEELSGPIRWFSALDERVRSQPGLDLKGFESEVARTVGMSWAVFVHEYILNPQSGYAEEKDRVWQSLFALTSLLGYDPPLLEGLVRTVVLAGLIDRIAASEGTAAEWPPLRLQEGAWATVELPAAVFPLPGDESAPDGEGWIEPYAVGDLQMVQQRLLGYSLGEVSAIENVLQGERKESTQRRLTRRQEDSSTESEQESGQEDSTVTSRSDLTAAVQATLSREFKRSYQTQYGPPTEATATGFTQLEGLQDGSPATTTRSRTSSRFAQEIANRTARQITRRVLERRSQTLLQEDEETVVRRFDATGSTRNVRGVYRWVNKVYALRVVCYGHRLMLEIRVDDPAESFIQSELALAGRTLTAPVSPAELGLTSPSAISTTEPSSPLYWANLLVRYNALDVQPPPAATATASLSVQGTGTTTSTQVEIPAGYMAATASLAASWTPASNISELSGLLGTAAFSLTAPGATPTLTLNNETARIPLGVTAASTVTPAAFVLNVEVQANLSSQALTEWEIQTYREVLAAYGRQRERYDASAGATPAGGRNPLEYRDIERRELKRDVMRQFLDQARRRLDVPGDAAERRNLDVGLPAWLQFLEQAFEWNEMTYAFQDLLQDKGRNRQRYEGQDSLFTAFLQAASARVLLPVRPGYEFRVPYFLATGMIWPAADSLTPVNPDDVALINDLKSLALLPEGPTQPGEEWQVTVPTSMTLLQDGPGLPGLSPEAK